MISRKFAGKAARTGNNPSASDVFTPCYDPELTACVLGVCPWCVDARCRVGASGRCVGPVAYCPPFPPPSSLLPFLRVGADFAHFRLGLLCEVGLNCARLSAFGPTLHTCAPFLPHSPPHPSSLSSLPAPLPSAHLRSGRLCTLRRLSSDLRSGRLCTLASWFAVRSGPQRRRTEDG